MDSVLFGWKIDAIERKAEEANRRLYELDSLRNDLERLSRAFREASIETDNLRDKLNRATDTIQVLEGRLNDLEQRT